MSVVYLAIIVHLTRFAKMVFKQMTGQSFRGWGGSVRRVGQSLKPAMSVGAPELGMLAIESLEFWDHTDHTSTIRYPAVSLQYFHATLERRYGKPLENVPCFFAREMSYCTFWWVFPCLCSCTGGYQMYWHPPGVKWIVCALSFTACH